MVGFRERRSTHVADMHECPVLPASLSALIDPLRSLVDQLSVHSRLPQVEVAVGGNPPAPGFRPPLPLTEEDHAHLPAFPPRPPIHLLLPSRGPGTAPPFPPPG